MIRSNLRKRFPHFICIPTKALSEEVFVYCEEELNLIFKINFDVRSNNGSYGTDFFFRDEGPYVAVKIKYSA